MTPKKIALLALLLPTLAAANSPFDGQWRLRPEASTWSPDANEQFAVAAGTYRCDTCNPKWEIPADGKEHSIANALGFDAALVKVVNSRTVRIEQRREGRVVREETYSVTPNDNTLSLAFTDRFAPKEVVGHITFERVGKAVAQSHLISGEWQPAHLVDLGAGSRLSVVSIDNGLRVTTGDGRTFDGTFDIKDKPVDGSTASTITLARLSPTSVQINHKQSGAITDVVRAYVSDDGKELKVIRADRRRARAITLVYEKSPDTVAAADTPKAN